MDLPRASVSPGPPAELEEARESGARRKGEEGGGGPGCGNAGAAVASLEASVPTKKPWQRGCPAERPAR